jgi:hypothetical protein
MLWSFRRRSKMEPLKSQRCIDIGLKIAFGLSLLAEEESSTVNLIDQLLQHPFQVAGFKPSARDEMYERS